MRPCPACGHRVFSGEPGSLQGCAVCGWLDDFTQLVHPDLLGANERSLRQAQARVLASPPDARGRTRDPAWRPLAAGEYPLEPGFASPVCAIGTPEPEDFVPYWSVPRAGSAPGEGSD